MNDTIKLEQKMFESVDESPLNVLMEALEKDPSCENVVVGLMIKHHLRFP